MYCLSLCRFDIISEEKMKKIFNKLSVYFYARAAVSALSLLLLGGGSLSAFFDNDVGNNGTFRLAFDVDGTATISPFIIEPTGEVQNLGVVTTSSTSGLTFDDVMIPDPYSGTYMIGAIVNASGSGSATVSLNRSISRVTNSGSTNVVKLRSATGTDGSVTVSVGETAMILFPITVHSNILNSI